MRTPHPLLIHVRIATLLAMVLLLPGFVGCSNDDDGQSVNVYVSADEHLARQVAARFTEATGIDVNLVTDTEARKTTGLAERLRREQDKPQADVFWSSEVFQTVGLADDGIFEAYEVPETTDWPASMRDEEHRWYGFAARARVIVYSAERVAEHEIPVTWMNLTNSFWRDRVVMADPRFGTTGGHLGAMRWYWQNIIGPGYYEAFLMGLAENNVRLLPSGNAGVVEAIVRGEADVGMTDSDDVYAFRANGHDLAMVFPDHDVDSERRGTGTLMIPNTVAIVKGGPNKQHAQSFMRFLLSEETERFIAKATSGNVPVRPGVAEDFPELVAPNTMRVDYVGAAGHRLDAVNEAMRRLSGDDEEPSSDEASPTTVPSDENDAAEADDAPTPSV